MNALLLHFAICIEAIMFLMSLVNALNNMNIMRVAFVNYLVFNFNFCLQFDYSIWISNLHI